MLSIIQNIPDVGTLHLIHVEVLKLQQKPNTLWLEFWVATGDTINYISSFAKIVVIDFDSF